MSWESGWSRAFVVGLPLLGFGCAAARAGAAAPEPVDAPVVVSTELVAPPARSCTPPPSSAFYVLGNDPLHPRIRYDDGQVSSNDSCMIRLGSKLNRKMPPAYVNGVPLGFC